MNESAKYHIFGHSAGGQFAHRFIMFKPNAHFDKVITSGSGWYTVTNLSIAFPYGFNNSPLSELSLAHLFQQALIIQVGELDNDPNALGLRHNSFADAQGLNRLDRADHFFNVASQLAAINNLEFNWELHINDTTGHDFEQATQNIGNLLFN